MDQGCLGAKRQEEAKEVAAADVPLLLLLVGPTLLFLCGPLLEMWLREERENIVATNWTLASLVLSSIVVLLVHCVFIIEKLGKGVFFFFGNWSG